ncbi:MAG: hypothetical protein IJU23_03900 [Proteobacteria bacterium]|nr:hypothetical protein [Pseudomonadota bacterium]
MKLQSILLACAVVLGTCVSAWAEDGKGSSDDWAPLPDASESARCKDGNCKCGNTFCPENGFCLNKHCYCSLARPWETNRGEPMYEYLEADGFGEFLCEYMMNSGTAGGGTPVLYCDRLEGCKTPSGAYFANGSMYYDKTTSLFGISGDSYGYYLLKNPNALSESASRSGDCVLPAKPLKYALTVKVSEDACFDYDEKGHVERGSLSDQCDGGERTARVFDSQNCPGGQLYCHGVANNPVLKPGEGYECEKAKWDSVVMSWVCHLEKGCSCGASTCKSGQACANGKCLDPAKVKPDKKIAKPKRGNEVLFELCGRDSAEKLNRDMSAWDAFQKESANEKIPDECKEYYDGDAYFDKGCLYKNVSEVDRCQVRIICDPWNIPRANRNEYVCEFDVGTHASRYHVDSYYYPRAVGLKCIRDEGCVCKKGKIKKGEYCNAFKDNPWEWEGMGE